MEDIQRTPQHALLNWDPLREELARVAQGSGSHENPLDVESLTDVVLALFLDYDGTLTPIVNDPADAKLPPAMHSVLSSLSQQHFLSIVTGRSISTIKSFVQLPLHFAGSHGYEIVGPQGQSLHEVGTEHVQTLCDFEDAVGQLIVDVVGATVENNVHCVSVHYRNVDERHVPMVKTLVTKLLETSYPGLTLKHGKKVFEISADIGWNKGQSVSWLLEQVVEQKTAMKCVPLYIGDDRSDEDAFAFLKAHYDSQLSQHSAISKPLSICVSDQPDRLATTQASYCLNDSSQVLEFLTRVMHLGLENDDNVDKSFNA